MRKTLKRSTIVIVSILAVVVIAWWPTKNYLLEEYGELGVEGAIRLLKMRVGLQEEYRPTVRQHTQVDVAAPDAIDVDAKIRPFREIGHRLGERAIDRNYGVMRGATIFDANGDGRLDIFFTYSQRAYGKQTTADGLLTDKPMPTHPNSLLINQGNDKNGDPVFASIQDLLANGNKQYEREELAIEGKYQPRDSITDSELGTGRIGWGAVSADFNGDGRLDLYVLNGLYGFTVQTKDLGQPLYPARTNLGREARREPIVLQILPFLRTPLEDGLHATVDVGGKTEREGRNTLYLNLGDKDGDGIPEWRDVTDETQVGGRWASTSAAVADYDRDGDLDLYVTNFHDPDYWGFGTDRFAGHRNQLYKNQLAETGQFHFVDVASELKVAGLHQEEALSSSVFFPSEGGSVTISKQYHRGRQVGEQADHSWAAGFFDWNRDGWTDLVVANDIGNRLRVYENKKGTGFEHLKEFDNQEWDGCWMGLSSGDLDGDMLEEILLTSCGSQAASIRNTHLLLDDRKETNMTAISHINYINGRNTLHHELIRYKDDGFQRMASKMLINHSPYIAPDVTDPANVAPAYLPLFEKYNIEKSLTGIEFAWHAPMFDVDNDGDLDVYMAGALNRGNDNLIGDWSGNPGRLLINESSPGNFVFSDRTLEYRALDITHMDYNHNPPRRPAPGTGWHKRDYIYVTDVDSYSGMGLEAANTKTHDIFRMHEAAFTILPADLNADGNQDLMVVHVAGFGYNSLSPNARNLRVNVAGRVLAVPAPNKVGNAPTEFEPGNTFVYINSGPPKETQGNWIKIRLRDKSAKNIYAIGARLRINGKMVRTTHISGAVAGSTHKDLHVGLGADSFRTLEILWPSGSMAPQYIETKEPTLDQLICIDRDVGLAECQSISNPA